MTPTVSCLTVGKLWLITDESQVYLLGSSCIINANQRKRWVKTAYILTIEYIGFVFLVLFIFRLAWIKHKMSKLDRKGVVLSIFTRVYLH